MYGAVNGLCSHESVPSMLRTIGRIAHLEVHWSDIVRVGSWLRHQLIGSVLEDFSSVEQCQVGIVIAISRFNAIHEEEQLDLFVLISSLVSVEMDFKVHGLTRLDCPFVKGVSHAFLQFDLVTVDKEEVLGDLLTVEHVDFSLQVI